MKFFDAMPYAEALRISQGLIYKYAEKTCTLPLENSSGHILAEDIFSTENLPSFDKSVVDGYAVKALDTFGASESVPALLKIIGKVEMGKDFSEEVGSGEAVYVPTGGKIPKGANAVIMIENCEVLGRFLNVWKSVPEKGNIFEVGADISFGELVAEKGREVTPLLQGVFAGLGIHTVKVFEKINFGIISTGDEIAGIRESISEGMIRDINTYSLSALVQADGNKVTYTAVCPDNFDLLVDKLLEAQKVSDIILISGGSSVGEKDYTFKAIEKFCGQAVIKGIALKPGKPTIAAKAEKSAFFGLPGHPMAAASVYETLIAKAVRNIRNQKEKIITYAEAKTNFPSSPGRTTCQPVKLVFENGKVYAQPVFSKSGAINALSASDGYVLLAEKEEGVSAGQIVEVRKFGR